ncbi:hypothetical protein [Brevundimonas goettingensis]|uniref:Uncharacterized protein n=1 Tax=Brevundimonas goettingensis TaxID=2774190 RepID=A0A975C220_9CAUL|nr:hypothetical protein [Brevundimonas goettingensis]QTC89916.1 hypothetical protein IFJ75_11485 [Brevundimonas goettingensis]
MTRVSFAPPNRLARILSATDTTTVETLARNAEARVEAITPAIAIRLGPLIGELLAACRRPDAAIQADARAVRRLALSIAETAAVARRNDLVPLTIDLCDLLDGWIDCGCWRGGAVTVQAEGLALLFLDRSLAPADQARLLAGLAAMTSAVIRSVRRAA